MSAPRQHWIMHLDMDAFFAAIEQRDNPEYRNRPVVVGARPGGRGVVATCSYEARRFGIRSAMPISQAYRRCPGAIYLRPDMPRYRAVSRQLMQLLGEVSPLVEPVSVDEAYLDLTGLERLLGPVEQIATVTRQRVLDELGLPCSIGVAPNRLLAKLASEAAKPNGQRVIRPDQVQEFLDPMPVAALRGVGKQTLKVLQRLGVCRVEQLRGYPLDLLSLHLGGKQAQALLRQSRGEGSHRIEPEGQRKSLSKETTFESDVADIRLIRQTLLRLSGEVGRGLRREQLKGSRVVLKLRDSDFQTHTLQQRLPRPSDRDDEIYRLGLELYQRSGYLNRQLRLIGIGVSGWGDDDSESDLFDDTHQSQRRDRLYQAMDRIGQRFGSDSLVPGRVLGAQEKNNPEKK